MEPFKITCVTCRAGLTVRNAALVGQIVACPRCGSMVEIAAPVVADGSAPEVAALRGGAPAVEPTPAPPVVEPVAPAQVSAALSYKLIGWLAATAFVATAGTMLAIFGRSSPAEVPVAPATEVIEIETTEAVEVAAPSQEPSEPVVAAPQPDPEPAVEEATLPPEQVAPSDAVVVETPPQPVKPARKFNSLELDADDLDLDSLRQTGSPASEPLASELPPRLEAPEVVSESPAPVVRVRTPDDLTAKRDPQVLLDEPLAAVEVKQMPLVHFVQFVSRLGGVPVTIAPEQLLLAGISPRAPISVVLKDTTIRAAIDQTLSRWHLQVQLQEGQAAVVRTSADRLRTIDYAIDDLVRTGTPVERLADWIRRLVAPESWNEAGGEVSLGIEGESLKITQLESVQYEILILLERVRLARGLATKSRYPTEELFGSPAYLQIAERMRAPATFTFVGFQPFEEVVRHWQKELRLPVLVDWAALAGEGIEPGTELACAIAGKPWEEALDRVLGGLGLGWRATIDGAVEISAASRGASVLTVEVYRLGRRLDESELVQVREIASTSELDDAGPALLIRASSKAQRQIAGWLTQRGLLP